MSTEYKVNVEAKVAASEEGNGKIMGYAMIWDVTDFQKDVTRKGAFAKTITERVAAGKVGLMVKHIVMGGDVVDTIGTITSAKEDEIGLWIEADLFDSQLAQETRGKVAQAPEIFGMSIGYQAIQSNPRGEGRELLELKLLEVTVTVMPAVEETTAAAKTAEDLTARVDALQATVDKLVAPDDTKPAPKAAPAIDHALAAKVSRIKRTTALMELEHNG